MRQKAAAQRDDAETVFIITTLDLRFGIWDLGSTATGARTTTWALSEGVHGEVVFLVYIGRLSL